MERKFFIQRFTLILLVVVVALVSCSKEEVSLSSTPTISLLSIAPKVVQEFSDSLVLTIAYEDGDGDLGGVHPDSVNLFITDSRIGIVYGFRIQELVPGGAEVPIKGTFKVVLKGLFRVTDTAPSETVSFEIYAKDKAGNRSNTVVSEEIRVTE